MAFPLDIVDIYEKSAQKLRKVIKTTQNSLNVVI